MDNIPGTTIPFVEEKKDNLFSVLEQIILATHGVTLSQLSEITGVKATTMQNWIKRGWVESPKGIRYGENQIVRIIIINMLKNCLQLEQIVQLMSYINGKVDDRSDDIIPDRDLFNYLCQLIYKLNEIKSFDTKIIEELIEQILDGYQGPKEDSKQRLRKSLFIMIYSYQASQMKNLAMDSFNQIFL